MCSTDCKEGDILGQLTWIIPVSVVGGIPLLGVLLLIVAKCILMTIVSHHTLIDLHLCGAQAYYISAISFLSSIMIGCQ